jgi:hypothetical protein
VKASGTCPAKLARIVCRPSPSTSAARMVT